jgi:D-lactate dehydrogenase
MAEMDISDVTLKKSPLGIDLQGDGSSITVEPGLILGEVNRLLAGHAKKNKLPIQYKLGPDPSSIDSCMIGGVVSNNSSGMCCGVSQNTYHTLKDLKLVLVDGTLLNTADTLSREAFLRVSKEVQKYFSGVPLRLAMLLHPFRSSSQAMVKQ